MTKRKTTELVNNLIAVSDTHCGCQMGLCLSPVELDGGGSYKPSKLQLKVAAWWDEFWGEWVPMVTKGEPYAVVFNGDSIDGSHHNATTQITHNIKDQVRIAYAILKPIYDKCEGRYYHIRGTEAHVGQTGEHEEQLAEMLGAIPDDQGNYARWELRVRVGKGLAHITHHIGTAGSMAYETSAIQKELEQAFVEAARWGGEIPDVVLRSHRHRNAETRIICHKGFATSCTTAGWQLKTPLVHRIAGGRQTQPQFGGTLIRCGDEEVFTRHKIWSLEPSPPEVLRV